ncbi:MAG: carbohydrate kinase [Anaerolineae bacterium]|nr:carbohydrate kinase [Anaerolineae bacterium]
MKNYLMGIDIGGTVIKVVIFDIHGKHVQHSSRKVIANYPHAGWTETDMPAIWQHTADAIRDALEKSAIAPGQILAIGGSGHGNGIYLLDKDRQPLRSSIMSLDTRADAFITQWNASSEYPRIWQKTYQQLWAAQPPALLAWLKAHEPENYKNIGAILFCKDYIKFCLTGQVTTDYSDISASSLFDIGQRNYSDELLKIYGIPECRDALPHPIESYEVAGKVTSKAAEATGLLEGTPVVGGLFDVSATALGAGVIDTGQACIIAGTWSINEVVTSEPVDDKQIFMNSIYIPDHYMTIEASATSAINLEWFVKHFCAEETVEAGRRGISVYDICNESVEQVETGSGNLFFHPFLFGSNVQANARAGFYGVAGWHTKNHLLRAVYEGVVYGHMSHIEKLKSSDIQMDMARFTGGAARSPVWVQMFADAIGIPMEVVEGEETGARGAAMCAGIGVGVYENYQDAVEKTVIVKNRYEPDHENTARYRERFVEYQNLVQVMSEAWHRLSKL